MRLYLVALTVNEMKQRPHQPSSVSPWQKPGVVGGVPGQHE